MPLVFSLKAGEDFYVGSSQFIVEEIYSDDQIALRRGEDGHLITVVSSRKSEILDRVTVSLGPSQSFTYARLVIDAPSELLILRGHKYRESPPSEGEPAVSRRKYTVSSQAIEQARRLGLFGNVEKRIARMAKHSAPFTHPEANRRFDSYLLKIEDDLVISIMKFDPSTGAIKRDALGKIKVSGQTGKGL